MAVQLYLFDANCSQLETFSICQGPIHPCRQIYRGGGSDDVDDDDEEEDDDDDEDDDDGGDEEEEEEEEGGRVLPRNLVNLVNLLKYAKSRPPDD